MEIFLGGVGGADWRGGGPESAIETGLTLGGWIMRRKRRKEEKKEKEIIKKLKAHFQQSIHFAAMV